MSHGTIMLQELAWLSSEQTQKVYARRQSEARIPGVKHVDMARIVRRLKPDAASADGLWDFASLEALAVAGTYRKSIFHGDKTHCKITDAVVVLENLHQEPIKKSVR